MPRRMARRSPGRRVAARRPTVFSGLRHQDRDPGALKVVDHSLTLLRKENLRPTSARRLKTPSACTHHPPSPFAFGYDEIQSRKMAQDFFVLSFRDHFPIVEQAKARP